MSHSLDENHCMALPPVEPQVQNSILNYVIGAFEREQQLFVPDIGESFQGSSFHTHSFPLLDTWSQLLFSTPQMEIELF